MSEIELCKDHIIQTLEEDPQRLHELAVIESLEDETELDELYELALDPDSWVPHDGDEAKNAAKQKKIYSFDFEPADSRFKAKVVIDDGEVVSCEIEGN